MIDAGISSTEEGAFKAAEGMGKARGRRTTGAGVGTSSTTADSSVALADSSEERAVIAREGLSGTHSLNEKTVHTRLVAEL